MATVSGVSDAPTIAERDAKTGVWHLTCRCPLCGKRHYHGGGDGDAPDLGYRTIHCLRPVSALADYNLVPATGDALADLLAEAKRDANREKRRLAKERREASAW